jgi:hypothetical protein
MSENSKSNLPVKVEPVNPAPQHAGSEHGEHGIPKDLQAPGALAIIIAVSGFVALLVVLFLVGWIPDQREQNEARKQSADRASAMPVVQFIKTSPQTGTHDLRLPCNVQANQSTAIFT